MRASNVDLHGGTHTQNGPVTFLADGSDAAPSLAFAAAPTSGLVRDSDGDVGLVRKAKRVVTLTGSDSAVNEIEVSNAAAGSAPAITAVGDDTDISLNLVPKGAGSINISLGAAAGNTPGAVVAAAIKFDAADGHTAAVGTSTGTVEIPAGAILLNIQIVTTVLWDAGTSTTLDVGDDDDPDGWFAAINLQATDLLVGEVLDISNAENWGGKNGVYLVAATGRKGRTTAGVDSGVFYGAASEVVATVTTVGTVPTVGTTYMIVTYMKPTQQAAAYAAT